MDEGMDEKNRYDLVCKERFDRHDQKLDAILDILRGKNREPGLIDDVRELERFRKGVIGTLIGIVVILFTQVVVWLRTKLS